MTIAFQYFQKYKQYPDEFKEILSNFNENLLKETVLICQLSSSDIHYSLKIEEELKTKKTNIDLKKEDPVKPNLDVLYSRYLSDFKTVKQQADFWLEDLYPQLQGRLINHLIDLCNIFLSLEESLPASSQKLNSDELSSVINLLSESIYNTEQVIKSYYDYESDTNYKSGIINEFLEEFEDDFKQYNLTTHQIQSQYSLIREKMAKTEQTIEELQKIESENMSSSIRNLIIGSTGLVGTLGAIGIALAPVTFGASVATSVTAITAVGVVGAGIAGVGASAATTLKSARKLSKSNHIREQIELETKQLSDCEELLLFIHMLNPLSQKLIEEMNEMNTQLDRLSTKIQGFNLLLNTLHTSIGSENTLIQIETKDILSLLKSSEMKEKWQNLKDFLQVINAQSIQIESDKSVIQKLESQFVTSN